MLSQQRQTQDEGWPYMGRTEPTDTSEKNPKHWPAVWVGAYNFTLLLLFIFGAVTQVSWEGFGFLPLLALTLPLSCLFMWLIERVGVSGLGHWGSGLTGTLLLTFSICNEFSGLTNSSILYVLLRGRQRKTGESEAWKRQGETGNLHELDSVESLPNNQQFGSKVRTAFLVS
jgi:hypothetical protein